MSDYTPTVLTESDVRNFVTPPLDYDDVTKAEILLKIEAVETYIKYRYFNGGSLPSKTKIPALLLVVSNLLSSSSLAKKYCTLASEKLNDYSYSLSKPSSIGAKTRGSPYAIIKSWHDMAIEMLEKMASPSEYKIRKANE